MDLVFAGRMAKCTADMYFSYELEYKIIARAECIIPRDSRGPAALGFIYIIEEYEKTGTLLLETVINDSANSAGIPSYSQYATAPP